MLREENQLIVDLSAKRREPSSSLALQAGVSFGCSYTKELLVLAIVPIFLELVTAYVFYTRAVPAQQELLIHFLRLGVSAWFVSTIFMYFVFALQGKAVSLGTVSSRAVHFMPKTFMSLFIISAVFQAFFSELNFALGISGAFFMVFLIWAPAFCLGETFVKETKNDNDDSSFSFDDEEEASDELIKRRMLARLSSFTHKSMFDWGFVRAFRFAGDNLRESIIVMLLLALASLLPTALLYLVMGSGRELSFVIVQTVLVNLTELVTCTIWAGTFLFLLSEKEQKELSVSINTLKTAWVTRGESGTKSSTLGRWGNHTLGLLLVLALCSGFIVSQRAIEEAKIPSFAKISVEGSQMTSKQMVVVLKLNDEREMFRWLNVYAFRLSFVDGSKSDGEEKVSVSDFRRLLLGSDQSHNIPIGRFEVYDAEGAQLPSDQYRPNKGPITVKLFFPKPKEGVLDQGDFVLNYQAVPGMQDRVAVGRFEN